MINWFKALEGLGFNIPSGTPTLTLIDSKVLEANDGNTGDNDGWFGRQSCIVRDDGVVVRTCREGARHDQETYGIVHISFSDDYGETWSSIDTYLDGSAITGFPMRPNGAGNPSGNQRGPSHGLLILCPDGSLLCQMWSSNYSSDNDGAHQSKSTDGGLTWSAPARIAIGSLPGGIDDDRVFFGEDYTIKGTRIYAAIRYYAVSSPQTEQNGVAISDDNGDTWTFLSWVTSTTSPSPRGTQEMSIEYVGGSRFICLLREAANQDGHYAYSEDDCATWSAPVDVTAAMGIGSTSWLGRTILKTRAHLQKKANWWNDRVLIVTGFQGGTDNQSTGARRNAAWVGVIPADYDLTNITWYGPYWLADSNYDGGYGCPFWNPDLQQFVQLSYISPTSLYDASTWQFNFELTFE